MGGGSPPQHPQEGSGPGLGIEEARLGGHLAALVGHRQQLVHRQRVHHEADAVRRVAAADQLVEAGGVGHVADGAGGRQLLGAEDRVQHLAAEPVDVERVEGARLGVRRGQRETVPRARRVDADLAPVPGPRVLRVCDALELAAHVAGPGAQRP